MIHFRYKSKIFCHVFELEKFSENLIILTFFRFRFREEKLENSISIEASYLGRNETLKENRTNSDEKKKTSTKQIW